MSTEHKDPVRVAAGLKSTLARDDTSPEAKMQAEERLHEMGATDEVAAGSRARKGAASKGTADVEEVDEDMHDVRVQAGYKAALSNPRVSEEAKEHAREYLEEHDAI